MDRPEDAYSFLGKRERALERLGATRDRYGTSARAFGFLTKLARHPSGLLGVALILLFVGTAVLAPVLAPYPPLEMHADHVLQLPTRAFPLGTDNYGRDLLSRVLYGARISLKEALFVVLMAAGIGVSVGSVAGYAGGAVDQAAMRLADVFLSFPALLLAMAIVSVMGPGLDNAIVAVGFAWWPAYARLVRSSVLSVKEEVYVDAARSIGAGPLRIMGLHVLPNCMAPLLVKCTLDSGMAVLTLATLSFLGLGSPPYVPEWGAMVAQARLYFLDSPWSASVPGLAVLLTVLGAALLGDALRDILDPTLRY